jgi:polyisoprenoid-binding protein YceI
MRATLVLLFGLVLLAPTAARAQAIAWAIDPGHSSAQFVVRHMLVANVRGEFDGPSGTVTFDPARVADTLKAEATIDARTVTTHNRDRDADLKSPNFFDVTRFQTITFRSKRSSAADGGHIALVGDLTMHGITREVTLDVEGPTPAVKDLDGRTRVGASASTVVNRRDFGLRYNELLEAGGAVVSDEVRITIDLEVSHK